MTTRKSLSDEARARAEARFQVSEQRKSDAEQVMRDLQDAQQAERAKTERLKALRIAKEQSDRDAAASDSGKPKSAKSAVRRKLAS